MPDRRTRPRHARPRAGEATALGGPAALVGGLLAGAAALLAVHFLLRDTYWDYSEGVYALSAHLVLDGGGLYTDFAGAQPPGIFLLGTALLAIHDSLEWLRVGVGCLQLLAGLIAARTVLDVTGSRVAAVLTAPLMLLTPWAVHEHGALTPELVALPVLVGAARLSADARRAPPFGVLCGVLPLIKFPLAIPAIVLLAQCRDRRRSAVWALAVLLAGLGLTTVLAGGSFWRETVLAQTQTGTRSLGRLDGFWAQAGWNVLGLGVGAVVALANRRRVRRPDLLGASTALAAALVITFLTNVKEGTGLNVTVPVEAGLVPLAVCGTVLALRDRRRAQSVLCVAGILFTLVQSGSLIASPHHSVPFLRAGSRPAWAILMTAPEVRAAVAQARGCPPGRPYSGPPLLALLAGRAMPGGQPDDFIITHSRDLAAFRARVDAAGPRCP